MQKGKKHVELSKEIAKRYIGPSVHILKAILEDRLTLEIIQAFEEDTHRTGKKYRSAHGYDEYLDRIVRIMEE